MQRTWILCVVALLLLVSGADAAYTYTSWEHDLNMSVSAVDTNEYGTVTFIGTANTLYCYDLAGGETWNLTVNGTPQKIVSTQDGDRALLYTDNDIVYYVNGTDGDVVAEYQMAGVGRAKDVTMKKDGQVFAFAYENTTYVVDDVTPGFVGTPYSWYEIPVTTGTWHKLTYQAANDILTLSKTGQSTVYMVNATRIPYHIPITVKNDKVGINITEHEPFLVMFTNKQIFDLFHNNLTTLELWQNWSAGTGEYSGPITFDIQEWNTSSYTMTMYISNITLNHTQSSTLYVRNNIHRVSSNEVSFDYENVTFHTVVYDDFNNDTLNITLWVLQPTYNDGSIFIGDGRISFWTTNQKKYPSGYYHYRSGIYSNYILNQNSTYMINTTWLLSLGEAWGGDDYVTTAGYAGFTVGVADPSTVVYGDTIRWGGLEDSDDSFTLENNSLITHGTLTLSYSRLFTQIRDNNGTIAWNATPYTGGLLNVPITIKNRLNLFERTMSAQAYNAQGTLLQTVSPQCYEPYNVSFTNNLRVFLTGNSYGPLNSYVSGYSYLNVVELSAALPDTTVTVGTYTPFANTKSVPGIIQYMDSPESGEWLVVASATTGSPVTGYVHHIYVPASGFSTTYSADTTGNSYDIKAADGCAFSIDAREITVEINRLDGVPVGTYTTGGSLTSVDIAMKNGLWAVAGSTDGKFYVFSKDATSGWYQDHASDSEESVTCVAMSWRGEMVVVGRSDGSVLMYPTGGTSGNDDDGHPDTTFPAQITVFQDGRLAVGKTVMIEKSETSNPYTWTAYATEQTDAQGKVVIPNADNGKFYKLTVDDKETVYAASSTSPQLTISVMTPLINGQWEFEAVYDEETNIITGSYTDVEPAQSITIRIVNTNTKQLVAQQTVYANDQLIVTVAGNPEYVYKVDVDAVRFTGNQIRMSKIVHTASIYNIPLGDLDVHMKNAIFTLIIMAVGGLFSYAHSTKGGLLLVALAGGFALFGFTTVSYAVIGIAGFVAIVSILIRGTRR